jgi:hypothetical protein
MVGSRQTGTLPTPNYIGVTGASDHDGKIFDQIRPVYTTMNFMGTKLTNVPMQWKSDKPKT